MEVSMLNVPFESHSMKYHLTIYVIAVCQTLAFGSSGMIFNLVSITVEIVVPVLSLLDQPSTTALFLAGLFAAPVLYQVYLRGLPRRRSSPLTYNPRYPVRLRADALREELS